MEDGKKVWMRNVDWNELILALIQAAFIAIFHDAVNMGWLCFFSLLFLRYFIRMHNFGCSNFCKKKMQFSVDLLQKPIRCDGWQTSFVQTSFCLASFFHLLKQKWAEHLFLLITQSAHLFLQTCVLPLTPTDCLARIFSPIPMLWPRIELTAVQLHLFEEPLLRMLYRLSFHGRSCAKHWFPYRFFCPQPPFPFLPKEIYAVYG